MYKNLPVGLRSGWKFRPFIETLEDRRVLSSVGTHPHAASHPPPEHTETQRHQSRERSSERSSDHEAVEKAAAPSHQARDESTKGAPRHEDAGRDSDASRQERGDTDKQHTHEKHSAGGGTTGQQEATGDGSTDDESTSTEGVASNNGQPAPKNTHVKTEKAKGSKTTAAGTPGATEAGKDDGADTPPAMPQSENSAAKARKAKQGDTVADGMPASDGDSSTTKAGPEDAPVPEDPYAPTAVSAAQGRKARSASEALAAPLAGSDRDQLEAIPAPSLAGSADVIADAHAEKGPNKPAGQENGGTAAERLTVLDRQAALSSPTNGLVQASGDQQEVTLVSTSGTPDDNDEVDGLPERYAASLRAGVVPLDLSALDQGMKQFLNELDTLGAKLTHGLAVTRLPSWLLAVGLAVTACEVARRQVKPATNRILATGGTNGDTLTWLPGPDREPTRG